MTDFTTPFPNGEREEDVTDALHAMLKQFIQDGCTELMIIGVNPNDPSSPKYGWVHHPSNVASNVLALQVMQQLLLDSVMGDSNVVH